MIKKFAAAAAAILITASSVGECAAFATKPSDSYEDPDYVAPYEGETEDGFVYYKTGEEIMIVDYKGEGGDIVIPEYIDGYPVTDIILIDFSNSNARPITFPGTIKEIDSYLITGISTLEEVTIGEGTECIGSMFCTGCENLRKVTLPDSLKEIGDSFFEPYSCRITRDP
ncbi:MAG TPA: leucine-rich repeat protein [Ruminococcus flavefaciens]|nr:leucine-rich repeat protein [Ruminococcus flavefaciens]